MEHHTIGKVEEEIIKYLATHRNSLIQPTYKAIKKDRKTVVTAFKNLERNKCLIKKGKIVTTSQGGKYPGYELTEDGIIIAVLANADLDKMNDNYPENALMGLYKKLLGQPSLGSRKLLKRVVRVAAKKFAQLASVQDNRDAVFENPDSLVDMAFTSLQLYSKLPDEEKDALELIAEKVERAAARDPEVKALWDKKKDKFKKMRNV